MHASRIQGSKCQKIRPIGRSIATVRVRAGEEDGVAGLLARDRKEVKLAPELDKQGFVPTFEDKKQEAKEQAKRQQQQEVLKSRKQRQEDMANAKAQDPNRCESMGLPMRDSGEWDTVWGEIPGAQENCRRAS